MPGEIQRFSEEDIRIKDLVLDDFFGYREIYDTLDENVIDRQATTVLLEIYGNDASIPANPNILVKRFVAALVAKRMLPGLKTYIATHVERSDVQREGYLTYYDQLNMLNRFEEELDRRIIDLRARVSDFLADSYAEKRRYDSPGATNAGTASVTYDPHQVGKSLFLVGGKRRVTS